MLTPIAGGAAAERPDGADDARTLTIYIDPPIEANGKTYTELFLEEPTGQMVERAEAELAQGMNVHSLRKYQIALVSNASKTPRSVIDKMRISQVKLAADFLSTFLVDGPPIGEI